MAPPPVASPALAPLTPSMASPNGATALLKQTLTGAPLPAVANIDLRVLSADAKRAEILAAFDGMWALYEALFANVADAGLYKRADPLRHPLIFYLGHTAVFYVNKLVLAKLLKPEERINRTFESLFAVGVDEMSWDTLLSDDYKWPAADEVRTYRNMVRDVVRGLIARLPLKDNTTIRWASPWWPILMGINHEAIHLETSSVLMRQLPLDYIKVAPGNVFAKVCTTAADAPEKAPENKWIDVAGGTVVLGRPHTLSEAKDAEHAKNHAEIYGWDNEYGYERLHVAPLKMQAQLVSNAEFLKFVQDGGYTTKKYWSNEGWRWVQFTKSTMAKFWRHDSASGKWYLRDTFREISLPWNWPVETNDLEANAYARWLTAKTGTLTRLPRQEELRLVQDQHEPETCPARGNLALRQFASSCPVDAAENKSGPFNDLFGNVWQHSKTPTYPYSGFKTHDLYDDFTLPTYDDQHNIIMGGSWISTANEAQRHANYAFRRHFFQHAGFRCVQPSDNRMSPAELADHVEPDFEPKNALTGTSAAFAPPSPTSSAANPYETDSLVNAYCDFHYWSGALPFRVENFAVVCARICEAAAKKLGNQPHGGKLRAFDLGCAVGRSTFELARAFDEVIGVDFSARFIQVGHQFKRSKRIRWSAPVEGEITTYREATLGQDIPLDGREGWDIVSRIFGPADEIVRKEAAPDVETQLDRIQFFQGDACNLRPEWTNFHVVLAANLIDRLYNPRAFLDVVHERIVPGGFLVLLSPYTWLEEFTPKADFVGGKKVDGENVFTKDGLEDILSEHFDLVQLQPYDKTFEDCHPPTASTAVGKTGLTSFHVPFIIRETHRKHQLTFSECTVWRRK